MPLGIVSEVYDRYDMQASPSIQVVQQERPAMAIRLVAQPQVSDASPYDVIGQQDAPTPESVSHPSGVFPAFLTRSSSMCRNLQSLGCSKTCLQEFVTGRSACCRPATVLLRCICCRCIVGTVHKTGLSYLGYLAEQGDYCTLVA